MSEFYFFNVDQTLRGAHTFEAHWCAKDYSQEHRNICNRHDTRYLLIVTTNTSASLRRKILYFYLIFTSTSPGCEKTAVLCELFLCNCRCPVLLVPPTRDRLAPKLHCMAPCSGGFGNVFTPCLCIGRLLYTVPTGNVLP